MHLYKLTAQEHVALGIILAQVYGCGQRVKGTGVLFSCSQDGANRKQQMLLNGRNGNKQCRIEKGTQMPSARICPGAVKKFIKTSNPQSFSLASSVYLYPKSNLLLQFGFLLSLFIRISFCPLFDQGVAKMNVDKTRDCFWPNEEDISKDFYSQKSDPIICICILDQNHLQSRFGHVCTSSLLRKLVSQI